MSEDDGKLCSEHMCVLASWGKRRRRRREEYEKNVACMQVSTIILIMRKSLIQKGFQKHNCEIIFKSTMLLYNFTSSPRHIFIIKSAKGIFPREDSSNNSLMMHTQTWKGENNHHHRDRRAHVLVCKFLGEMLSTFY